MVESWNMAASRRPGPGVWAPFLLAQLPAHLVKLTVTQRAEQEEDDHQPVEADQRVVRVVQQIEAIARQRAAGM
jgi:hypothetical protein